MGLEDGVFMAPPNQVATNSRSIANVPVWVILMGINLLHFEAAHSQSATTSCWLSYAVAVGLALGWGSSQSFGWLCLGIARCFFAY